MKIKKRMLALAIAVALPLASIPTAHAGGATGGATEVTQILNNIELVSIYMTEIEQLAQQLSMLENMVTNTNSLPIQAWSGIDNRLTALVNAIAAVNGVVNATEGALAQVEQQFGNGDLLDAYETRLRAWTQGLNRQIGTALEQMGMNANRFSSTQQALAQIQAASQSATGRMQVLQAGNQIAGLMVNEMQSLHSTMIAAEQARLNAVAIQENRDAQERAAYQKWLKSPRSTGW